MIEKITNSNFYNNKTLTKGLKFVSENSPVYTAGLSLLFQSTIRPVSTLLTPKTPKEDKKLSFTKSLSSAVTGFLFMLGVSTPFSKAVKNIDNNPKQFLTSDTVKNLSKGAENLSSSKSYRFITQLFKLGLGFALAYPKALVNNTIIPKVIEKSSKENEHQTFTGKLENVVASVVNNKKIQNFAQNAKNTQYTTHLIALSDIFSTMAFVDITNRNKKLNKHQKNILNNNAVLSTALCLGSGYGVNALLKEPEKKFLENLKNANKHSADVSKYIEGAQIVKTSLIFGLIYYGLIPVVSTFLSSKIENKKQELN